jgi:hypothetical protein
MAKNLMNFNRLGFFFFQETGKDIVDKKIIHKIKATIKKC